MRQSHAALVTSLDSGVTESKSDVMESRSGKHEGDVMLDSPQPPPPLPPFFPPYRPLPHSLFPKHPLTSSSAEHTTIPHLFYFTLSPASSTLLVTPCTPSYHLYTTSLPFPSPSKPHAFRHPSGVSPPTNPITTFQLEFAR